MSRSLAVPLALAAALFCVAPAQADTLTFAGSANGHETVDIVLGAPNLAITMSTAAAGFTASLNGGPSFVSYCIDLYQPIGFGTPIDGYSLAPAASHAFANTAAAGDIGKLFAQNNVVDNSVAQAAFQIAIWEIAYETTRAYDLASGAAQFSGGSAATSGALALASSWLGSLGSTTNNAYTVWTLESAVNQDQVFATPVPEPSTYALLAGGLLAIGFVARRRAARPN
jgi:hypothetical protein